MKLSSSCRNDAEQGNTLVEYALVVAIISIVGLAALATIGGSVRDLLVGLAS